MAIITWLMYAGTFYVAWTIGFRLRYGRWPVAYRLPPRNRAHAVYMAADLALNLSLIGYTLWLLLGPSPQPLAPIAGATLVVTGGLLRLWTVITLGPNWRMGQDEDDQQASYIATGPYRFLKHPINAALIVVAFGQALLTGFDGRAWLLLSIAILYYIVQAGAEEQFWKDRDGGPDEASEADLQT